MKLISRSLIFLDFYSGGPVLLLNGNRQVRSEIGGVFSIIVLICITLFCWLVGNDIFYKKRPTLLYKRVKQTEIPYFNIYNKPFLIRVYDGLAGESFQDEDMIFNITITHYQMFQDFENSAKISENILQPQNCSSPDFKLNAPFGKEKCFYNQNITIGGAVNDAHFSAILIQVSICDPKVKACYDYDKIRNKIYETVPYIGLKYFDVTVDPVNYTKPIINLQTVFENNLDPLFFKSIDFYYTIANVTTDYGWLFQQYDSESDIQFKNSFTRIASSNKESKNLLEIWIQLDKFAESYDRQYIKIQAIFANLGGILKVIYLVFIVVLGPLNQKMINIALMSEIYDFSTDKSSYRSVSTIKQGIQNLRRTRRIASNMKLNKVSGKNLSFQTPNNDNNNQDNNVHINLSEHKPVNENENNNNNYNNNQESVSNKKQVHYKDHNNRIMLNNINSPGFDIGNNNTNEALNKPLKIRNNNYFLSVKNNIYLDKITKSPENQSEVKEIEKDKESQQMKLVELVSTKKKGNLTTSNSLSKKTSLFNFTKQEFSYSDNEFEIETENKVKTLNSSSILKEVKNENIDNFDINKSISSKIYNANVDILPENLNTSSRLVQKNKEDLNNKFPLDILLSKHVSSINHIPLNVNNIKRLTLNSNSDNSSCTSEAQNNEVNNCQNNNNNDEINKLHNNCDNYNGNIVCSEAIDKSKHFLDQINNINIKNNKDDTLELECINLKTYSSKSDKPSLNKDTILTKSNKNSENYLRYYNPNLLGLQHDANINKSTVNIHLGSNNQNNVTSKYNFSRQFYSRPSHVSNSWLEKKRSIRRINTFFNNKITKLKEEINMRNAHNSKLNYSFYELVLSVYCCFSKLKPKSLSLLDKQYNSCLEDINEYVNFNTMIKKIQEINNLKLAIFTPEQFLSFKYVSKPEVHIEGKNRVELKKPTKIHHDDKFLDEEEKISMLIEYFANCQNLDRNTIDYRLLEIIDEDIKELINEFLRFNIDKYNKITEDLENNNENEKDLSQKILN